MTTRDIIAAADSTLDQALALDWSSLTLSSAAKDKLLGQVWGESRFGSTPDWGASNNWGAVTYHKGDGKFIAHADHDAQGRPVTYRFQVYDTQLDAARDWLKVIMRGNVPLALQLGTTHDLAAAMYANHYFTGVKGTAEDRIAAYASLIDNGARFIHSTLLDLPDLSTTLGVQTALSRLGYDPGPLDGVNGPHTKRAVMAFQSAHGLVADGIVGPLTSKSLYAALEALP